MTFTESGSFVLSSIFSLLTLSGMQLYRNALASSQLMTIVGGFAGSLLYVFLLTALGNLEKTVLGHTYQAGISEVIFSVVVAVSAAASVHRVSASTCFLFSLGMTWSIYKISQETYGTTSYVQPSKPVHHNKKKR